MKLFYAARPGILLLALFISHPASAAEWKPLFDGKTLDGWVQRGGKAEYSVENGEIIGIGVPNSPNSFLCTDQDYGDFIFEVEFKVDSTLNSGIQIRSQSLEDYKDGRVHGYQVEIDPSDRGWSGGIYDESRRGWLNDLADNDAARYAFKQSDWNHYRIEAIGDRIRTWINGVPAADLKDFMTPKGFIALQVHGIGGREDRPQNRWRNIRIQTEKLEPSPEPSTDAPTVSPENLVPDGAEVRKLADGFTFTEGPARGPDGRIYFNDIPNELTHVYDPKTGETVVWREGTGRANGLWWTPGGRLLYCEGGARRISSQLGDEITTVVDSFEGKKLNSPNDVALDWIGGFFFTDPRYGSNDDRELESMSVYYVNRRGKISLATDDVTKPNGVIFSPDYKTLYVSDTDEKKIFAFDVKGEGKLTNKREFFDSGSDGMTVDVLGNVYLTSGTVLVISPEGEQLADIVCPEHPANVTFGGPDNQTLYITARTGFYAIDLALPGAR
tara:strand:+ start:1342 stop:2838 length:1497 start_codon:yes stop_codon:yes gene_type:complete